MKTILSMLTWPVYGIRIDNQIEHQELEHDVNTEKRKREKAIG